jgi:hypothetical protein
MYQNKLETRNKYSEVKVVQEENKRKKTGTVEYLLVKEVIRCQENKCENTTQVKKFSWIKQ